MPRRWMPNILTVINLLAGILAILLAFMQQWAMAVAIVFAAALFDSVDGRIARRLNIANDVGRQLDIFSDLISFGVAPATIAYLLNFADSNWNGGILVAVFLLCGVVRLVRFKVFQVKGYYVGLPITIAGPMLAVCSYLTQEFQTLTLTVVLLVLAGLMISTIRVPKIHFR
ncbi:MAG: CDP-diacylglycerol--serine O-phosphatidyltransferase [Firmicutes bacterium]|nr:CDP-diacylglycerol--serine O-phosphatidyltransferase [Bacillota bacterium]